MKVVTTSSSLPPVVFIHGWKASVLTDQKTGKNEFDYTLGTLLGITADPKLELPLEWDAGGKQVKDNLVATEPCHSARFCGIKIGNIYGTLLDHLEETRDLRTFTYDWRRPICETASIFQEFLVDVKDNTGRAAQVVAHSMGCLVTLSVLNKHPELFHSILFGAAAFSPNVSILKDFSLLGGKNSVVKNTTMFTPKINVSNPAPFYFLACPGERQLWGKPNVNVLRDWSNESIQHDLHDAGTWKRLRCGIYHPDSEVEDPHLLESWLQSVLDRARSFRQGLIPANSGLHASNCPPITVLRGDHEDTEFGYLCMPDGIDMKGNIKYLRGDGRITLEDALPPKGIPVLKVVTNDRDHSQVLNDVENVDLLLALMLREKKQKHVSENLD
jgi:pimeloyl-ACP methyl ester carboxylesterase